MRKLTPSTALLILFIAILIIVPIIVANPFHIGCKHITGKSSTGLIIRSGNCNSLTSNN